MILLHAIIMPVPVGGAAVSLFTWSSLLYGALWTLPFLLLIVWQKHHSHKHSHGVAVKLDRIIDIIRTDTRFSESSIRFLDVQSNESVDDIKSEAITIAKKDGRSLVGIDDVIQAAKFQKHWKRKKK